MRRAHALALAAIAGLACSREPASPTRSPGDATHAPGKAVAPAEPAAGVQASPAPAAEPAPTADPATTAARAGRRIEIVVNETGFSPREVKVRKGEPATLVFTRVTERTCMTAVDIPAENVKNLELPLNVPTEVTITPAKAGVEAFHCSAMAMGNGKLLVEE